MRAEVSNGHVLEQRNQLCGFIGAEFAATLLLDHNIGRFYDQQFWRDGHMCSRFDAAQKRFEACRDGAVWNKET